MTDTERHTIATTTRVASDWCHDCQAVTTWTEDETGELRCTECDQTAVYVQED